MRFQIKNWKLALLAIFFIGVFISLGTWQMLRAQQKKVLLSAFTERTKQTVLNFSELNSQKDLRFYQTRLAGVADNAHTLLLDNKIWHGQVGYEVYTPFKIKQQNKYILIDRGFIRMGQSRNELPNIAPISAKEITGMLNLPPRYVAFGSMHDDNLQWPLRVQYINVNEIEKLMHYSLLPYTLSLAPTDPYALSIEWQAVMSMPPERHMGYAVQWFALALTLLILFVALNCERSR